MLRSDLQTPPNAYSGPAWLCQKGLLRRATCITCAPCCKSAEPSRSRNRPCAWRRRELLTAQHLDVVCGKRRGS
eukprot:9635522-Alexandrium_andersonii.AAC.1